MAYHLALSKDSYENIKQAFPYLEDQLLVLEDDLSIGTLHTDYFKRVESNKPYLPAKEVRLRALQMWSLLKEEKDSVTIWCGHAPLEACGLLAVAYELRKLDITLIRRLPKDPFYRVTLCDVPPDELATLEFEDKFISQVEIEEMVRMWFQFIEENSELRICVGNALQSVDVNYFDPIISQYSNVGDAMFEIRQSFGFYHNWNYLMWRKSWLKKERAGTAGKEAEI